MNRLRSSNRESGQILVLTTVSMIAVLGIMALSLDASFMFEKRNRLHAAADAAAKSAAMEVLRNPSVSLTSLEKFADQQVIAHGFVPTRQGGTTSVVVNHGPSAGAFAGNVNYVEAIVSESTSTFFANILGWISMTPLASAVAGAGNPSACLMTEEDMAIGNTALTLNGCGVGIGGDLSGTNPNARIVGAPTPIVGVTGVCTGTCTAMGSLTTGAPATVDPLEGLALPTAPDPSTCIAGVAATLPAGCYTSIASTVTTLSGGGDGIYYITGPVNIDNLSGTNVMLYLTGAGHLQAANNKQLHLSGRTSGTYTGIAIFQDPTNPSNFDTGNNFALDVKGAIYMPGTDVDFPNGLTFTATTCTLFIAKSLTIRNGNGSINNSGCAGAFSGAAFLTASIAQ
ncbi:MAG TPA: pilus assembly protein TadG-related protein [Vicinamibacterales bacterium]|nr:pilus assembly protein TadG-related protein [Vicinamibacterales bacterium]